METLKHYLTKHSTTLEREQQYIYCIFYDYKTSTELEYTLITKNRRCVDEFIRDLFLYDADRERRGGNKNFSKTTQAWGCPLKDALEDYTDEEAVLNSALILDLETIDQ